MKCHTGLSILIHLNPTHAQEFEITSAEPDISMECRAHGHGSCQFELHIKERNHEGKCEGVAKLFIFIIISQRPHMMTLFDSMLACALVIPESALQRVILQLLVLLCVC